MFGIQIDAVTVAGAIDALRQMIEAGRPHLAFNVNVDICMQTLRDPDLRAILRSADLVLVDGTPMLWASRLLQSPLPARVSGSDFLPAFCAVAARSGYRVFLLGARPGVADQAKRALVEMYPGLRVVGTYAPPLGFERDPSQNADTIDRVRTASPDVLFVALGAPKEQRWLNRHRAALNVPVAMGIGSSLDYLAGRLRRAPLWMQRTGLEWLYRLNQEPGRLWRRYLINDPPFFFYLLREALRRRVGLGGQGFVQVGRLRPLTTAWSRVSGRQSSAPEAFTQMNTSLQVARKQDGDTVQEQRASAPRIGVIIEKLPGSGFGGAQAVGFWTVEALQEAYQVTIITGADDLSPTEANSFFGTHIRPDAVEIVVVPMQSFIRESPRLKLLAKHLVGRHCRGTWRDYDLIISTAGEMDLGVRGIQYVHYPMVLSRGRSKRHLVFGLLSRAITGYSQERMALNWTLTNSRWTAQRTREAYGIEPMVVYPPVPDEVDRLSWSCREDGFVYVGRLSVEKNLERIIRIVKGVRERAPEFHLHMIGGIHDHHYWKRLKNLIANERDWLFLEGELPRDEMVKLVGSHKYGIHGMEEEHFGIGIAEMAKSGCVVFVPRGGGQVEIVQADELIYDGEGDAVTKILRVVDSSDLQAALHAVVTDRALQFSSQRFMREMRMVVDRFLAERDGAQGDLATGIPRPWGGLL